MSPTQKGERHETSTSPISKAGRRSRYSPGCRADRAGTNLPNAVDYSVVPIAAGGAVDTAARIIAEKLQEKLQQSVVVENRPGAGSIIGTNFVAKAAPDGHTLLLMEPGAVLARWLNKTVPFDVTSDFSPI